MSDCGGGTDILGINLTFDDNAANPLTAAAIVAGTYRPTDLEATDNLPASAPQRPFTGTTLMALASGTINGTWSLWCADDAGADSGAMAGGWSITFTSVGGNTAPALTVNRDASTTPVAITNGTTIAVAQGSTLAALDLEFSVTDADTGDTLTLTAVVSAGITGFVQAEWNAGPSVPPTQPLVATPSTGTFNTFGLIAVQLTANDGTVDTVLSFTIRVGLIGLYTVASNNPGGAFDYGDIGDFFDDLEDFGVAGPVTLEVSDAGGNFTSTASYELGSDAGTPDPVDGNSAVNNIIVVAAPGSSPVVAGSGATLVGAGAGTMSIRHVSIAIEGLTIQGGTDFGLACLVNDTAPRIAVRRNRIYGHGGPGLGLVGLGGPNLTNAVVENNFLWANDGDSATLLGLAVNLNGNLLIGNCTGTVIRNNTIVHNNGANAAPAIRHFDGFGGSAIATLNDNIVYNSSAGCPTLGFVAGANLGSNPTGSNYNIYEFNNGATFHADTTSFPNFTTWQGTYDANGYNVDPQLASTTVGTEDLRLSSVASPAVDTGDTASAASEDIFGTARPNGVDSDIGAHEFLHNAAPVLALATGSTFAAGSDFGLARDPGASIGTANLEATDPDGDPMNITVTFATGPMGGTPPSGITAPTGGTGLTGTVALNWSGNVSGADVPGTYEWDITLDDGVNPPVGYTVTITINDLPPVATPVTGQTGTGTPGSPFLATYTQTMTGTATVALATISDPNTSQTTFTITGAILVSGTAGAGFDFSLGTGATFTVFPDGTLNATDVGIQVYEVEIEDVNGNDSTFTVSVTVNPAPSFSTANPLPDVTQNVSYSQTVTASGGTGSLAFTLTAGAFPAGISIAANGAITGLTTVTPASFSVTLTVTDSLGVTGVQVYDIDVVAPAAGIPVIDNASPLPNGTVGTAYSVQFTATGGAGGNTFAVAAGTLPGGLSLSTGGLLDGTPNAAEVQTFTIRVTDSANVQNTAVFTLTINTAGGGGGKKKKKKGSEGCTTDGTSNLLWLALAGSMAGLLAVRSRRSRA
ncbi:MAG: hypothetical protein KF696_07630 [Planctomycetes bacterium]|nr:hypothetical protein [Planctomycetota bacterium]